MQRSDHGSGIGGRGASAGRRLGEIAGRSLEVVRVPFDDLDALQRAARRPRRGRDRRTGPGRGGHPGAAPRATSRRSPSSAARAGALLVVDEVRTALRMGPTLASAARGVEPDIVCLGSSLANGMPFGVTAVGPSISRRARVARRDHEEACPPLVCAAANATIRTALGPTLRTLAGADVGAPAGPAARAAPRRDPGGPRIRVRWWRSRRASTRRCCCAASSSEASSRCPAGTGSVRMLAPLILERREADSVVEALAAIILASRPPRRRPMPRRRSRKTSRSCCPGTAASSPAAGRALSQARLLAGERPVS